MEKNDNVGVAKYVFKFGVYYLLALIAIAVITKLLKIDSSSTSMASVIFATMMTSRKFINENKRVPNSYEKKRLIWYSLFTIWIVPLIVFVLFLPISGEMGAIIEFLEKVNLGFLFGVILFLSAMNLLVLYFGYSWLANKQYESLVKKEKIQ